MKTRYTAPELELYRFNEDIMNSAEVTTTVVTTGGFTPDENETPLA